MNRITRKLLSFALAAALMLTSIGVTAFAESADKDSGPTLGASGYTVAFAIDPDPLYFPEGAPIAAADLLAGVTAEDESGEPVGVAVSDLGGLDLDNPQMRGVYPNPPYEITYTAAHPVTGDTFTETREVYVTIASIMPLSGSVNGTEVEITGLTGGRLQQEIEALAPTILPADITKLTITGNMNASDPNYIRNFLTSLAELDMSGATVLGNQIVGSAFQGCISLESIILPNSLTAIGDNAFQGCSSLESIILPDSLQTIGNRAFASCGNLVNITLPDTLTTIGDGVFDGCISLESITLPDTLTTIGDGVFDRCISLESIILPDSLQTIGNNAFASCGNLVNITLPDTLTTIGDSVFDRCISLESITLPDSLQTIGYAVFYGCTSLEIIIFNGSTPPTFDTGTFYDCSITYIIVPSGSEAAYKYALTQAGYPDLVNLVNSLSAPSFTTQPQDQVKTAGENVTFTAAAIGNPAPVYQWQYSTDGGTWNDIGGATSDTLTLTSVTTAMSGYQYRCAATNTTNSVNTAYSNAAPLTVNAAPPQTVSVTGVTLNKSSMALTVGESETLSATVQPDNATDKTVSWSSSNTSVATVSGGAVTAVSAGTATITVTTNDGSKTATCTVTFSKAATNGNGGSSGDSDTTPASTTGSITVNGVSVSYSIQNSTGIMTLNLTSTLLDRILAAMGENKTIAIGVGSPANLKGLEISFPPSWFGKHTDITFAIQSGIGGINLNNNVAKNFPAQNTTATVSLNKGSVKLSAQQSGKAVTWSNIDAPVIIYMPYTPAADTDTNAIVLYDKATGAIVAHSFYSGGKVYGAVSKTGEYDVKVNAISYTDTVSHWAKDDIAFVSGHGLTSGTTATTFSPNMAITRADFIMALGKLSGADVSGYKQSSFTDVSNSAAAMPYIEWATKNGIVQGNGDGTFGPDQQITREQMAVMMVGYAKATSHTLPVIRQTNTFDDDANINSWAKDAVKTVQRAGIINGKSNNLFDPQGSMTRAEASAILRRFAESVVNGEKGWVQNENGQWQYIQADYTPKTGWLTTTEGNRYWFDENGFRASGKWVQIDSKWYYFREDGKLAVNTTIDGFEVGADGARQ